jgi:hypothetical protein
MLAEMSLDLRTWIRAGALAALSAPAGLGGCSDDGVPAQNGGTTGGSAGDGASGISTTMTAGGVTMTGQNDDDGEGTGIGTTASPPPTGTADGPADSSGGAEDGTASITDGSTGAGSGSGTGAETGTGGGSDTGTGSESGSGSDGGNAQCEPSPAPGVLEIGTPCASDSACASGVCYDYADYDPFCGGTACSVCCETNQDCEDAMQAAGAPQPGNSFCLADGRCDMVGTGLGGPFFCAGG